MFELFAWILVLMSLLGVVLNIRKSPLCFYLWTFTNASWASVNYIKEFYAQGTLFTIYFLLALWGIWEWQHKERRRKR